VTDDELNSIAWRDFVLWSSKQPDALKEFQEETGFSFLLPKNGLEAAIDAATGAQIETAEAFVKWVTENFWGLEYAPRAYREKINA